jgi:hypothetical protein
VVKAGQILLRAVGIVNVAGCFMLNPVQ